MPETYKVTDEHHQEAREQDTVVEPAEELLFVLLRPVTDGDVRFCRFAKTTRDGGDKGQVRTLHGPTARRSSVLTRDIDFRAIIVDRKGGRGRGRSGEREKQRSVSSFRKRGQVGCGARTVPENDTYFLSGPVWSAFQYNKSISSELAGIECRADTGKPLWRRRGARPRSVKVSRAKAPGGVRGVARRGKSKFETYKGSQPWLFASRCGGRRGRVCDGVLVTRWRDWVFVPAFASETVECSPRNACGTFVPSFSVCRHEFRSHTTEEATSSHLE